MPNNMENGGAEAPLPLNKMKSDDVFGIVSIMTNIGLTEINLDSGILKKASFKPPMMIKDGKKVPLPRSKWTKRQKELEKESSIAQSQLVIEIIKTVFSHLPDCRNQVFSLLAISTGTDEKTIENLDAIDLVKEVNAYVDRQEFFDFFTQALRLFGNMTGKIFSAGFSDDTTTRKD
jgi:hypothetical protein